MTKTKSPLRRVRGTIIFLTFLVFPLFFKYLSPYLILRGAYAGVATASAVTFTVLFILSLFFGRFWCGWICPGGGVAEACSIANSKQSPTGKFIYIKWGLWAAWMGSIIYMFVKAGKFSVNPLYYMENPLSITDSYDLRIYYTVLSCLVILPLIFGRRAMCKYICWIAPFKIIGRKLSNLLRLPALRLKGDKESCISCKICNKECPMNLDVMSMVKSERVEHAECILCGNCVDSCPRKAVKFKIGTGSR